MHNMYESPLTSRYASKEMSMIFSEHNKFTLWRRLWVVLAEAQRELGLDISMEQIKELSSQESNINYEVAKERERVTRHDVMSHVYAYGEQCPTAKGIIHLGATSCYVGDNADIIIMKEGLVLIRKKIVQVIENLKTFALRYKGMPTLAFTHLQPAQLTTVGKRACLWIQELIMDLERLSYEIDNIRFLGVKGTTGTQASFLTLFNGDIEKVKKLDELVCEKMGFKNKFFTVTGQTYPRKQDMLILQVLSSVAQSAYKFSNDIRLLQSMKEIEEPFEKDQIGSSAMAYKRNPMRSERMSALSRYVIVSSLNPAITASTQWFERTLDDSANKRISIPEAYLAIDGILNLYINVSEGLVVYPRVIEKHINEELPFMATENILMEAVKRGGDRQELHERIRVHSMEAGRRVKEFGEANDLIDRLCNDKAFGLEKEELLSVLRPENYTGRAESQVEEFISTEVKAILEKYFVDKVNVDIEV